MIKVIIVDDHNIVRQGLKQILTDSSKIEFVGEAAPIPQLETLLQKKPLFDVLVLDLSLPGKSGFDFLPEFKKQHPNHPVLILSVHPEEQFALRALKAGASGYLSKECAPEQLVEAIQSVHLKKRYITPAVAELLTDHLNVDPGLQAPHTYLSHREFQVLLLIAEGLPLTEMAEKFNVSVKTISTYRLRLMEKMDMKTNADLIHYVVKSNLKTD